MQELAVLSELALLLFIALIGYGIAKRFQINALPVIVILGLLFGGILPKTEPGYAANMEQYIIISAGLAAFLVGTSIPIRSYLGELHVSFITAIVLSLLLLAVSFLVVSLTGQNEFIVLFVGIILSAGSLVGIHDIFQQHEQQETEMEHMSNLWIIGQYLLLIPVFLIFDQLGSADAGVDFITPLIQSFVMISFSLAVGLYVLPFIKEFLQLENNESETLLAVGAGVGLIMLADVLAIPSVVAAFTIGLGLSEQFNLKQVKSFLWPLLSGLIAVCIGALVDFALIDYGLLLVLLLIIIPVKMIISTTISLWFGSSIMEALGISISHAQISELVFVLGVFGLTNNWFDSEIFVPTLIAATAVGYLLSPLVYLNVDWIHALLEKNMRNFTPNLHRGLFINSGSGRGIVKRKQQERKFTR